MRLTRWYLSNNYAEIQSATDAQLGTWVSIECRYNHADIVKWMWSACPTRIGCAMPDAFWGACECANIDLMSWMLRLFPTLMDDSWVQLFVAGWSRRWEDVRRILSANSALYVSFKKDILFKFLCETGNVGAVQEIISIAPYVGKHAVNGCYFTTPPSWSLEQCKMEYVFLTACNGGHLPLAQWAVNVASPSVRMCLRAFMRACENGHLVVAQWVWETFLKTHGGEDYGYAFKSACAFGHIHVAEWILDLALKAAIPINYYDAFQSACSFGKLDVAQWLYGHPLVKQGGWALMSSETFNEILCKGQLDIAQWAWNIWFKDHPDEIDVNVSEWINTVVPNNDLRMAKWYVELYPPLANSIRTDPYVYLYKACNEYGTIEFASWIHEVANFRKDTRYNTLCIQGACESGNLSLAQWMYQHWNKDVHLDKTQYDSIMLCICRHGYMDVYKWIHTIYDARPSSDDIVIWISILCGYGHVDLAQYILGAYSKREIIQARHWDKFFYVACCNGHLHVVKWLCTMPERLCQSQTHIKHVFQQVCINGHVHIAQWLMSVYTYLHTHMLLTPPPFSEDVSDDMAHWLVHEFPSAYVIHPSLHEIIVLPPKTRNWKRRAVAMLMCKRGTSSILTRVPDDLKRAIIEFI